MHDVVRVGDVLRIGAPLNYFPLAPDGGPAVLLAAGIGMTPLLAMVHSLIRAGRPLAFHYFVRSDGAAAYRLTLASRLADVATAHTGLTPDATDDAIAAIVGAMNARAHLHFCGPAPFMAASTRSRARRSAMRGCIASTFARRSRATNPMPAMPRARPARSGSSSRARNACCSCRRGNRSPTCCSTTTFRLPPREKRASAAHAGRGGLEGTPDHRDAFLSAAEKARNECMMPCVSRCRGERLVPDLRDAPKALNGDFDWTVSDENGRGCAVEPPGRHRKRDRASSRLSASPNRSSAVT